MTDCTQLSDRMVAVVHGRAEWSAQEAAHLAACAECAAEWRVLQAGAAIGADLVASLPADFLATRVVAALRNSTRRPWWARPRWLALPMAAAAAVAVMVLPGKESNRPARATAAAAELGILPEMESLEASDLELVLQLLPDPEVPVEIESFDELTEDEVTRLLNSLEG